MSGSASVQVLMSQGDVHYAGGLVAGARVLELFGDAATVLMLESDGVEGLLARYDSVEFLRPVFAGDLVRVRAQLTAHGRTSRRVALVAEVAGEPVCRAEAVCVARAVDAG